MLKLSFFAIFTENFLFNSESILSHWTEKITRIFVDISILCFAGKNWNFGAFAVFEMPKCKNNTVQSKGKAKVARTLRVTDSTVVDGIQSSQLNDSWLSSNSTAPADHVGESSQIIINVNNPNLLCLQRGYYHP